MKIRLLKKLRRRVASQFYIRKRAESDRCDLYQNGREIKFFEPYSKIESLIREVTHEYMMSYIAKRKKNVYIW